MSRAIVFEKEPASGLSGLQGLTAPGDDEDVSVVVDAIVIGAKSDGKTQFITHAVRTLDARSPADLTGEERAQNEKMLGLVLNAKRPLPEANPDKKVRHYVFRVKPENLLGSLQPGAQLALLFRARLLLGYALLALLSGAVVLAGLRTIRGDFDLPAVIGAGTAALLAMLLGVRAARRDFLKGGEAEIVFWDVAGEDVYSDRGAGGYHAFLAALTTARRARRRAAAQDGRSVRYAFAPILICNPLAVGRLVDDSPYARLRMIMPTFAALHQPLPEVLVVVNRWELAKVVCGDGDREADDHVALLPVARDAPKTDADGGGARLDPLPLVKRYVVQRHCVDGEPPMVGATRFRTVHYDAGLDTEVKETPWTGFDALGADARARWADPGTDPAPKGLIEYRYAEGPGALGGEASAGFYDWLATLMWKGSHKVTRPEEVQLGMVPTVADSGTRLAPVVTPPVAPPDEDAAAAAAAVASNQTVKMFGPLVDPPVPGVTPVEPPEAGDEPQAPRGGFRSGT